MGNKDSEQDANGQQEFRAGRQRPTRIQSRTPKANKNSEQAANGQQGFRANAPTANKNSEADPNSQQICKKLFESNEWRHGRSRITSHDGEPEF